MEPTEDSEDWEEPESAEKTESEVDDAGEDGWYWYTGWWPSADWRLIVDTEIILKNIGNRTPAKATEEKSCKVGERLFAGKRGIKRETMIKQTGGPDA
jgi:hypothetical protein